MIRWIVGTSLKFRFLVLAIAAVVLLLGVTSLFKMPVDVFPEFEPPHVEIQTEALGLSADEVESLVTLNIEEFLIGTPWLESMRSESIPGLSSIMLIFKEGTDVMRARQVVQESLSRAYTLPNISGPPVMLQPLSATNRAMMISLSSKELSPIQISVLARWTIKPKLMGVPGVANVVIWGQRERQMQVQIDPRHLQAKGVTQDQIIKTTGDALWFSQLSFLESSFPGTGGWIDTPNQRLNIRHVLPISTPNDFASLPVEGSKLHLGEVAQVVEGHPPLIGDAILGKDAGIILLVEKFPGSNALEVTKGIEEALNSLKAGLPGLEIDSTVFRLADFIETAIGNLTKALIFSAILVILVLGAFLYDWRSTLISLLAIPLSLLAAILVLYLRGDSINIMVLAGIGIAVGAVVDDAIIDIENIVRRLRQFRKEGSKKSNLKVILDASLEVRHPIIYATIIIMLAILPVFFLTGITGSFFRPLALSYMIALFASMAVALTLTPALALTLLDRAALGKETAPLLQRIQGGYERTLSRIIETPKPAFIAVGAAILVGLVLLPFLGHSLLPVFKERTLLVEIEGTPGLSHPEISRITTRLSDELSKVKGVHRVGANAGRAITGDRTVDMNSSQIWVRVDPSVDYEKTVDEVKTIVAGYKGLDSDVYTYLNETIRETLTGETDPLVVRVFGPDRKVLREQAEAVKKSLANVEGIADLVVEGRQEEPHVEVTVDLEKARPYGIKPGDVRRASATIFAGIAAGNLFEEQKVFDVVVWGIPEVRQSFSDIKELLIDTPDGKHVALEDIAEVKIVPGSTVIHHDGLFPRVDIVAKVNGRDLGKVSKDIESRLQSHSFPIEYHAEILGEYQTKKEVEKLMYFVAALVVVGIFLLLEVCFGSWRLAAIAFLALPVAIVGGVIGAVLDGGVITLGSVVGFLAVLGISARNGINLINHYQYLLKHEEEEFGAHLILRGARERLGPILMTALTTAVAMLPIIFFGSIPGLEIEHPMAAVIFCGLITATLLNMFIIPVLFLMVGKNRNVEELEGI
jgi:CzcA family heavy metal efflux pump